MDIMLSLGISFPESTIALAAGWVQHPVIGPTTLKLASDLSRTDIAYFNPEGYAEDHCPNRCRARS